MDFISPVVQNVAASEAPKLLRHLWNFLTKRRTSGDLGTGELKKEAKWLEALRHIKQREAEADASKMTTTLYNTWLQDVDNTLQDAENLIRQYNQRAEGYEGAEDYGNQFRDLLKSIQELVVKEKDIKGGKFLYEPVRAVIKLSAPDIERFRTLETSLQETISLLGIDRLRRIAILGPVGVGKTCVLKNLNNHEQVARMFDIVIWAKATVKSSATEQLQQHVDGDHSVEELQSVIARRLGLHKDGEQINSEQVSWKISEELRKRRYLLLLDEVIDPINLCDIGIPENNNGGKVVFATESSHVCNQMRAERQVAINRLKPDEAWTIFRQIVGEEIRLPNVEPIARKVAEECDGLPLVLQIVGAYFKGLKSSAEWRNGLTELINGSELEDRGFRGIERFVKLCYDKLKNDLRRQCFLYAALLFPARSNIEVDHLVDCWGGERFLSEIGFGRTNFQNARDDGAGALRDLSNLSLAEADDKMIHVQVSGRVRQAALRISSADFACKFSLHSPSGEDHRPQAKRISLVDAKLEKLPERPICNMLLSLLLQRNLNLGDVPDPFFLKMPELLVLDLSQTGISSLPTSISKLKQLKVLLLVNCTSFTKLPCQAREFVLLEVLDIRGCSVDFLPYVIGELVNLKCLRVSYYRSVKSENIGWETKVIEKLSKLEELVINVGEIFYNDWSREAKAVLEQVASLTLLSILGICLPDPNDLSLLSNRIVNLSSSLFSVGCPTPSNLELLEHFKYKINHSLRYHCQRFTNQVWKFLPQIQCLELIDHPRLQYLSDFMHVNTLQDVRGLLIQGFKKLESISCNTAILNNLEQLYLRRLQSLQSIVESPVSGIQQLPDLRRLVLQSCPEIRCLIGRYEHEGPVSEPYEFPRLEILELKDLQNLSTICEINSVAFPNLREIKIYRCPNLKGLPLNRKNAAELKLIEADDESWQNIVWQSDEAREHLQRLRRRAS